MPGQRDADREENRFLVIRADPRNLDRIPDRSVHLAVTAPPVWPVSGSGADAPMFGAGLDYPAYAAELGKVLQEVFRLLVPGGRLVCIASDIWLSRRRHGRHRMIPFTADISLRCREIGFDHLTPVLWHRPEAAKRPAFLGKPYEPNGAIRLSTAMAIMQRKPGGYRRPTPEQRKRSRIQRDRYRHWFQQIWPAVPDPDPGNGPVPVAIAERLIRMFSYWGDTVLDPFCGPGAVLVAALKSGRSAVGIESDPEACRVAVNRIHEASNPLFNRIDLTCRPISEFDDQEFSVFCHEHPVSHSRHRNSAPDRPDPD